MDKRSVSTSTASAQERRWYAVPWLLKVAVVCIFLGQVCLNGPRILAHIRGKDGGRSTFSSSGQPAFAWEHVEATKKLIWHPCPEQGQTRLECARLAVPLDYFNGTTDAEVSLALVRVPAKVPPTHPRYGGAVLFNPGGPGGSGVNFLSKKYHQLSSVIERNGDDDNDNDNDETKHFDYISFDPRGVGLSSPKVRCFSNDLLSFTWDLRVLQEGILGSSDAAFGRLWSMTSALSGSCSLSALTDDEDIKKFVSTASVATDMLTIVERHGEWRESEAMRLLLSRDPHRAVEVPTHLAWNKGQENINYWGFSYGTYLGATFASMYPDRINRLIVDGVVDPEDYKKSLWADNLADTEREMRSFYKDCAKAGWPNCALANEHGSTSTIEVESRIRNITDSLLHNPLPVLKPYPEVITYSDVKNMIFVALYAPIQLWPVVAQALYDIEHGNGTIVAARVKTLHQLEYSSVCGTDDDIPQNKSIAVLSHDATIAIGCGDGDPQGFVTRELFQEHWHNLTKISPTIGPMWALHRAHCIHWTVRPLYRFTGPFVANTSHPLLFIGNSRDPVTPVRNARKLVGGYGGAHLVEQDSSGHCSIAARSKCTESIINQYFQQGTLPEKMDTSCSADEVPFGAPFSPETQDLASLFSSRLHDGAFGTFMPLI